MDNVNFMPWRERQHTEQQRRIQTVIVSIILLNVLLTIFLHLYLRQQCLQTAQAVNNLTEQINQAHARQVAVTKNNLHTPSFAALLTYQNLIYTLFQTLGDAMSANACLTAIEQEGNDFLFSGTTNSITDLMLYFEHWQVGKLFAEFKIEQLSRQVDEYQFRFRGVAVNTPQLSEFQSG